MIGRQMSVTHGHLEGSMTKKFAHGTKINSLHF
jgi:hypothetical protein